MMFNIGYKVAMNLTNNFWQCFIFHDVDLLPEDDRNLYNCPNNPRHMSVGKNIVLLTVRKDLNPLSMHISSSRGWQHFKGMFCPLKVNSFS